ncbi:hypothetical protein LEP1GSC163_3150 [Leptospira santarosai str. CBC379]|nr:hypothetical protein LEP1GSC163_3150 [Leptospira santarosai str. CBC379]EMP81677.1 hypothetical protein LEP1GSC162_1795 [Leptospira santarosai str. CBC1531]
MVVFAFLKYQHFIIVCISSKIDRILYNKNINTLENEYAKENP